jgi:hypothetical protein
VFSRTDCALAPVRTIETERRAGARDQRPSYIVNFSFAWDASKFHYAGEPSSGELEHTWSFIVDATGTVAVQPESGNFPPQYVR